MIIVSTMSEPEALAATNALDAGLPPETGFEVYLKGSRFYGRDTKPAIAAEDEWPRTGERR